MISVPSWVALSYYTHTKLKIILISKHLYHDMHYHVTCYGH